MSNRKRKQMRYEEAGLRITENAILAHNATGEILNIYIRHRTPLDLWHRNGLTTHLYETAKRYGALWREVCRPQSPAHSDTTRIIVDGSGKPGDGSFIPGGDGSELLDAQAAIGDEETTTALNRLCGMEDWPHGDKRRFKRICRKGLEVLAVFWRKR